MKKIRLNDQRIEVKPDDPFYPWIAYQLGKMTYDEACHHLIKQIKAKQRKKTEEP